MLIVLWIVSLLNFLLSSSASLKQKAEIISRKCFFIRFIRLVYTRTALHLDKQTSKLLTVSNELYNQCVKHLDKMFN